RLDRPLEVLIPRGVAWGEVPSLLLGEPADRRLEEVAVALDQVRQAALPRAEDVAHLGLCPRADSPLRVETLLAGDQRAVAALDGIAQPLGLEGRRRAVAAAFPLRCLVGGRQRAAHRMAAVVRRDLGVAPGAGLVPHEGDPRPGVEIRRLILDPGQT